MPPCDVMSSEAAQRASPSPGQVAPYRWYVFATCTVLAVAVNYVFGKEMAWDLLHYHFYAGFSALNDRFGQDFYAAGSQSYFYPYAYVPFYVLIKLGLPGLAVGTVLAVIHSVLLWLTYELACRVSPSDNRRERFFFALSVTTLAFMNPVLLQQIGSSFADITTAILVLGGWLLLIQAILRPRLRLVVFAAILLGLSTALKLTNGLYAAAAFFLVVFLPLPIAARIRNLFCFGATLAGTFVLATAPWSVQLARNLGNPMFPILNILSKPETAITSGKHYRFIPESLTDGLLRPFAMTGTDSMIAEELAAPDVRYAFLLVVFVLSALAWAWRSRGDAAIAPTTEEYKSSTRALTALGFAFAFAWIVWLDNSGNSRYFIPMASVSAVLAVALLFRLLVNHTLGRNAILLALFVAQGTTLVLETDFRWNQSPWAGRWFNVEMPESLANRPSLYLSIGTQSNSFIIPFLAKGSGVINIAGGYPLGPDGADAARVRAMIARNSPNLRVLVGGDRIYPDSALLTPLQSDVDDVLSTFDLRVDMSDCETITVYGLRPMVWWPLQSSAPAPATPPPRFKYTSHLASCHLVADNRDKSAEVAARRAVDVALDHLEESCPAVLQPRRLPTQRINGVWVRMYTASDLAAWVSQGQVKIVSALGDPRGIAVGSEAAWARGPLPLECGRRNGRYYFAILPEPMDRPQATRTLQ
jgi:hypothetical protein